MKRKIKLSLIDIKLDEFKHINVIQHNTLMLASYLVHNKILPAKNIQIISDYDADPVVTMKRFKPDVVGISAVTSTYYDAYRLAKRIKKELDVFVVLGGHHISGFSDVLDAPFDVGVVGEGEKPLAKMVKILNDGGVLDEKSLIYVPNVVYRRKDGSLMKKPAAPMLKPEEIPPLTWSLISRGEMSRYMTVMRDGGPASMKMSTMFTARGCPYNCSFCARQVLWNEGRGFRFFPVEHVGDEIERLYRNYGVELIYIQDDTFAVTKPRIKALIKELKRRRLLGKVWFYRLYVRANLIDEEFARLLKKLGAVSVSFGIESGSDKILKYLKAGAFSVKDVKQAIRAFEKEDIYVYGSFMLFSPNETPNDLKKSYKLAEWYSKQPTTIEMELYQTKPYPGTKLWADAVQMGVIDERPRSFKSFKPLKKSMKNQLKQVYFRNGMTDDQLEQWIVDFSILQVLTDEKMKTIPGWTEAEAVTQTMNDRMVTRNYLKQKVYRVLRDPRRLMMKSFEKSTIWKDTMSEIISAVR